MTVYKVQSKTLDKAIISLGNKEMHSGSDLVALSRVRKIEDLAFTDTKITFDRLLSRSRDHQINKERFDEEQRLLALAELNQ